MLITKWVLIAFLSNGHFVLSAYPTAYSYDRREDCMRQVVKLQSAIAEIDTPAPGREVFIGACVPMEIEK